MSYPFPPIAESALSRSNSLLQYIYWSIYIHCALVSRYTHTKKAAKGILKMTINYPGLFLSVYTDNHLRNPFSLEFLYHCLGSVSLTNEQLNFIEYVETEKLSFGHTPKFTYILYVSVCSCVVKLSFSFLCCCSTQLLKINITKSAKGGCHWI